MGADILLKIVQNITTMCTGTLVAFAQAMEEIVHYSLDAMRKRMSVSYY
jgi:hypothetical protein